MTWGELDIGLRRAWTLSRDPKSRRIELMNSALRLAMSIIEECPKIRQLRVFGRGPKRAAEGGPTAGARPISGWSKVKTSLS